MQRKSRFIVWLMMVISLFSLAAGSVGAERIVAPHAAAPIGTCANLGFGPHADYAVGNFPVTLDAGDLDHDGKPDLVAANSSSGSVSVLPNNGDGIFGTAINYPVGPYPRSLRLSDLNNDGSPDVVVTLSGDSNSIVRLLNNGAGSFSPPVSYTVGLTPQWLTVADFNNDGKPDVATISQGGYVSVVLGDGAGGFGPPQLTHTYPYQATIISGDFNRDGKADVAPISAHFSVVSRMLGNGDGTFQDYSNYYVEQAPYGAVVGDFNLDGKLDVATANLYGNGGNGNISVLLGNGDGTFQPRVNFPTPPQPESLAVGDFNGDSNPDLAIANYYSDTLGVLLGDGSGSFAPSLNFAVAGHPHTVVSADFNGDGNLDLAATIQNTNQVSVLLNTCPATPTATPAPPTNTYTPIAPTDTYTPVSATNTKTPSPIPTADTCLDSFEPDNDPDQAHLMSQYIDEHHIFCRSGGDPNGDVDWVKVGVGSNHDLLLGTAQGISITTVITLYDTSFNMVTWGYGGVFLHVESSSLFYAAVTNSDNSGGRDPDYSYDLYFDSIHDTPVMPTPTTTPCPIPFGDINGNTFYNAIIFLTCRNIVSGVDATHFGPAGTATRAQFAKVVVLGFAIPTYTPPGGTPDFTDVPANYFAFAYIESGYHAGILSGFDPTTCQNAGATPPCYIPNRPITRAQLTKLVVGAAHYTPYTPTQPSFSDVGPSNIFYVSIETAHYKGVINGYSDNTFRPNNNIRRDEMAQIVYRGMTTP